MVEFEFWWLLIIPLFFGLGWFAARIDIAQIISESTDLPSAYFKGLNFLIKNQYEKAAEAFSHAVKINNESLEIHFVLGSLYRRTGQLDKAINLHIDLLETRELNQKQQESVKAELALDYFKAGLYDRSEELLHSLNKDNYHQFSLNTLLDIYSKEREWNKAIKIATELEKISGVSFRENISHFYCEIAVVYILEKNINKANESLRKALDEYKNCVRANILLGDICESEERFEEAISYWKKVEYQQPEYLGLVASKILNIYQRLNKLNEGLSVLSGYYDLYNLKTLLSILYSAIMSNEGPEKAETIARNELIQRPSLLALDQLFEAHAISKTSGIDNIELIQQTIKNAIGDRRFYSCTKCGFQARQFHWHCPACNSWESFPSEPIDIIQDNKT
jgi:lipopolysaccharide biosynthesis regulator YciM|tara:strand:- start:1337 stop:2515 length:1179 start_codon:yes stop_codon:yes gene_type:complete